MESARLGRAISGTGRTRDGSTKTCGFHHDHQEPAADKDQWFHNPAAPTIGWIGGSAYGRPYMDLQPITFLQLYIIIGGRVQQGVISAVSGTGDLEKSH